MDIALIAKDGTIENVIVADSIKDAKKHYPDFTCVERGNLMLEPGGSYKDGKVKRAPQDDAQIAALRKTL